MSEPPDSDGWGPDGLSCGSLVSDTDGETIDPLDDEDWAVIESAAEPPAEATISETVLPPSGDIEFSGEENAATRIPPLQK